MKPCPKPKKKQKNPGLRMWLAFRENFLRQYLANGGVSCITCGMWFSVYLKNGKARSDVTLDHHVNRSLRPDLKYDPSNIVPMCLEHNILKKLKPRKHG